MPSNITKVAVIGTGVIGAGWIIRTLAHNKKVTAFDKDIKLKKFDINRVIVCSGRSYAKTPIEKFCEVTGAKMMFGRFMPGTLTNPSLPFYTEPQLVIVSDPQVDSQAITEATNAGIPVIGLANTDNVTSKLDLIIPANNRGRKALATVYWLLARGILEDPNAMTYEIDDFETKTSEVEEEL